MAKTEAAARSSARARWWSRWASTWAPRAKAAATRPARLGLIRAPGGAARNTGRYLMKYSASPGRTRNASSASGSRHTSWSPTNPNRSLPVPSPTWA